MVKMKHVVLSFFLTTSLAFGAQTSCPQHFADGQAPDVISSILSRTKDLCYEEFAVKHSGISKTPLYAAEKLTKERLVKAKKLPRKDTFHPELKLSKDERAELSDYKGSGFDRGHMAPNADFSTVNAQDECFTLANMVPQVSANNSGIWSRIEAAVRGYVVTSGSKEVYVVTGPIFFPKKMSNVIGRNQVSVPVQIFKAVYDPTRKMAGVYLVDNAKNDNLRMISLHELKVISGIDPFPSLPDTIKNNCMKLPTPKGK